MRSVCQGQPNGAESSVVDNAAALPVGRDRRGDCRSDSDLVRLLVLPSQRPPLLIALHLDALPVPGEIGGRDLAAILREVEQCEQRLDDADKRLASWWSVRRACTSRLTAQAWRVEGGLRLVAFLGTTAALTVGSAALRRYGALSSLVHAVSVVLYLGLAHFASNLADRAATSMPTRRAVDSAMWTALCSCLLVDLFAP